MTIELDLASSQLDRSVRIVPASFETTRKSYKRLDIIDKQGFYILDSIQVRAKDRYTTIITEEKTDTVFFDGSPELFIRSYELLKETIENSEWSHKWLKTYRLGSGVEEGQIPYEKLAKQFGTDIENGSYSFYKLANDASAIEMPTNTGLNPDKVTLSGEKKALKKWLKQPALQGLKYRKL